MPLTGPLVLGTGLGLLGLGVLYMSRRTLSPGARGADASTRGIFEAALDAVVVMDSAGRIIEWNPQAEAIFGRSRADAIGTPLAEHLDPGELRAAHSEAVLRATSPGAAGMLNQRLETVAVRRDGTRFPIEIAVTPVNAGKSGAFSAFIRDISERRAAQLALRASEVRYRMAFEQAAVGMAETALDGRFLRVNPAFASILAYAPDDLAGARLHDLVQIDDRREFTDAFDRVVTESPAPAHGHTPAVLRFQRKDGPVVWALSTSSLVRDGAGGEPYALTIFQDVTERKRLEEELRQTQKMEAVGRLAGGIAHDFNNVLAGIVGYADLVQHTPGVSAGVREDVRAIASTAQQGADLAKYLLTLARRTSPTLVRISLQDVVDDVYRLISRTFGRNVRIGVDFTPDPLIVHADRSQISNALLNLALNARDAMPAGGTLYLETRRVYLEDAAPGDPGHGLPDGAYARITVSDNGTGMTPDVCQHIFDPFFTTKTDGRGTGLGLAMVHSAVTGHGGIIAVRSKPDVGTTFTLHLPIRDDGEYARPDEDETLVCGSGCVLIADDDETVRKVATRMLVRLGYTVVHAEDGDDAVGLVWREPERFALAILDGDMPRLAGRAAAAQLQAVAPRVPLVLATADAEGDPDQIAALGFRGVLKKPFSIVALSRVVSRFAAPNAERVRRDRDQASLFTE